MRCCAGSVIGQIQPRQHALDHAGSTAPPVQIELDLTDHADHTDQEYICLKYLHHEVEIDYLSEVWKLSSKDAGRPRLDPLH